VQTYCKPCRAKIDHERYERLRGTRVPSRIWERGRNDWLLSLKKGRPCTDCGRTFPPEVMQWDHVPGAPKLGNISTDFRGRSREEILAEIAKCELVCANLPRNSDIRAGRLGRLVGFRGEDDAGRPTKASNAS
jgi:hypothetical protein